ncbi:hypothetical protein Nepgr_023975 [Nepenthes gracilis]|uniref:Uncharacterized protein n=1 Tax=Nepenthes gracilis TaxID=150966 RepID=A0AAD3T3U4_NEPGR|nr:hypothetical protein Nepgr_023975 [Nepenthes gracilis]
MSVCSRLLGALAPAAMLVASVWCAYVHLGILLHSEGLGAVVFLLVLLFFSVYPIVTIMNTSIFVGSLLLSFWEGFVAAASVNTGVRHWFYASCGGSDGFNLAAAIAAML